MSPLLKWSQLKKFQAIIPVIKHFSNHKLKIMNSLFLPLVNWGLGTIIIGVFGLVCIILVIVVYNLSRSTNNATNDSYNELDDDKDTKTPI